MREIKFRGMRERDGEWVYGYYVYTHDRHRIIYEDHEGFYCEDEVIPETVGQYTGLKDKNGAEIYEGDIVTSCWYDYEKLNHDVTGEVIFNEGWMAYCIWDKENKVTSEMNGWGHYHWTIEVIGNIYDNPELLLQ